jgi:hypothetical protein
MIPFFPFIYEEKRVKKNVEPLPQYLEEAPYVEPSKKDDEEAPNVIIIEIM